MHPRVNSLKDRAYREAFIGSQVFTTIPYQVRALRKQNRLDQNALAAKTGMKQSRISAIENPSGNGLTLDTLIRLAAAFDVGLMVRFVPFSELLKKSDDFEPDSFTVTSFSDELAAGAFNALTGTAATPKQLETRTPAWTMSIAAPGSNRALLSQGQLSAFHFGDRIQQNTQVPHG
jgi:transcriptional regulator with XRE-family HTH domain